MFAQVEVEQTTLNIPGIPGEQPAVGFQRLPHLLQQQTQERGLQFLSRIRGPSRGGIFHLNTGFRSERNWDGGDREKARDG
jgi:hypothetical protein